MYVRVVAMSRVLYTDYDHAALMYMCAELRHGGTSCAPNKEFVFGLSRTSHINDAQVRAMLETMSESCFSQDDFQWFPQTRE